MLTQISSAYINQTQFLAATKQLYGSVRPSVRSSLTSFSLCPHHRVIIKSSGVITIDRIDVHAKGQGDRSEVMATDVKPHLAVSEP